MKTLKSTPFPNFTSSILPPKNFKVNSIIFKTSICFKLQFAVQVLIHIHPSFPIQWLGQGLKPENKITSIFFLFHLIYFFPCTIIFIVLSYLPKKDNKKVYEDYINITGLFFENWYWNIQTILLSDKFYKEGIQSWWSKNFLLENINRSSKHTRINWWFHVYFPGSWCYKIKTLANVSFTYISNGNL